MGRTIYLIFPNIVCSADSIKVELNVQSSSVSVVLEGCQFNVTVEHFEGSFADLFGKMIDVGTESTLENFHLVSTIFISIIFEIMVTFVGVRMTGLVESANLIAKLNDMASIM